MSRATNIRFGVFVLAAVVVWVYFTMRPVSLGHLTPVQIRPRQDCGNFVTTSGFVKEIKVLPTGQHVYEIEDNSGFDSFEEEWQFWRPWFDPVLRQLKASVQVEYNPSSSSSPRSGEFVKVSGRINCYGRNDPVFLKL